MSALDDAFHQFNRGEKHPADLDAHFITTFTQNSIRGEVKSNSYIRDGILVTAYVIYSASIPKVGMDDSAFLGEAASCFRSSLDYLAWALVAKQGKNLLTERQKRNIFFPMSQNRKKFWLDVNKFLPNLPNEQRKFIERYQPYKRSPAGMSIRHLRTLPNTHKHRNYINPVIWIKQGDFEIKLTGPSIDLVQPITFHIKSGQEVDTGTKIATIVLDGGQRQVDMSTYGTIIYVISKSIIKPSKNDDPVPATLALNRIRDVCSEILADAQNCF